MSERGSPVSVPQSPEKCEEEQYVVLAETNGEEIETWYYFFKFKENEDALNYLQKQLEKIDFYIEDDLSTFDLDLDHKFSAQTAKEMTKLEINSYQFHHKFDGKLKMIDLGLKKKHNNVKMMEKAHEKLSLHSGNGDEEDWFEDSDPKEDVDPEDLCSSDDSSSGDDEPLVSPPKMKNTKLLPKALRDKKPVEKIGKMRRKK